LRDAAEAGLFDAVWCLSPDRLARVYAYQVLVLDELARFNVGVPFTDAPDFAPGDPQATLLTQVQGVIAEYEKAKIAERYRRGKLFRAPRRGNHHLEGCLRLPPGRPQRGDRAGAPGDL
jgi:site-specific DNA recombinase